MKRLFFCLMAMFAIAACTEGGGVDNGGDDDGQDSSAQPQITLSMSAVDFTVDGGKSEILFTATEAWTAQVVNNRADDWCKIEPASGDAGDAKITVTTSANDTPDDRSASIIINAGTASKTINVSQKQKDALTVTSSRFEVDAAGGEVEIRVKSNVSFEYSISSKAQSWITYQTTRAMQTSVLVFSISENEGYDKREGWITIKSGTLSEIIDIYQMGQEPTIVLSENEYALSSQGETIAVDVKSNIDVEVVIPDNVYWITENTTRGISTNTYYFDIAENESYSSRKAEISFVNKANNIFEKVKIMQAQKGAIVVADSEYEIDGDGGELDFAVQSNSYFTVTVANNAKDWIEPVIIDEPERKVLHLDIAASNEDTRRTGVVTLSDGYNTQKITINQAESKATSTFVYIPDPVFKTYCLANFDQNGDGEITVAEARGVTIIEVYSDDIESLEGIEFFENLEVLWVVPNHDESKNVEEDWRASGYYLNGERVSGKISALDLSHNTKLRYLNCSANMISTLDLSNNPLLEEVYADCNLDLASIRFTSQDNAIWKLSLFATSLEYVDLSPLVELQYLWLQFGLGLRSIDLSNNDNMVELRIAGNRFGTLDVSNMPELTYLTCRGNRELTHLDISNTTKLAKLYCYESSLSSIDGLSDATSLDLLSCFDNQLTSLDVSDLENLEFLYCDANQLTSLDVSNLENLESLYCYENQLTSLDVSNLRNLEELYCGGNNLTTLYVSNNTYLYELSFRNNNIASIDLSKNVDLEVLECSTTPITSLNLSKNKMLLELWCHTTELSVLDLTYTPDLEWLQARYNPNLSTIYVLYGHEFEYYIDSNTQLVYVNNTRAWVNNSFSHSMGRAAGMSQRANADQQRKVVAHKAMDSSLYLAGDTTPQHRN